MRINLNLGDPFGGGSPEVRPAGGPGVREADVPPGKDGLTPPSPADPSQAGAHTDALHRGAAAAG